VPDYLFIDFKVFQRWCSFFTASEHANYYCGENRRRQGFWREQLRKPTPSPLQGGE